jgi:hypothetical protein
MAAKRIKDLRKRFFGNLEFFDCYSANIKQMLEKGYAKPVSDVSQLPNSVLTWYLPHHAVLNPKKPGKF